MSRVSRRGRERARVVHASLPSLSLCSLPRTNTDVVARGALPALPRVDVTQCVPDFAPAEEISINLTGDEDSFEQIVRRMQAQLVVTDALRNGAAPRNAIATPTVPRRLIQALRSTRGEEMTE